MSQKLDASAILAGALLLSPCLMAQSSTNPGGMDQSQQQAAPSGQNPTDQSQPGQVQPGQAPSDQTNPQYNQQGGGSQMNAPSALPTTVTGTGPVRRGRAMEEAGRFLIQEGQNMINAGDSVEGKKLQATGHRLERDGSKVEKSSGNQTPGEMK